MELFKEDYVVGVWFAEKKDYGNFQLTVIKRNGAWLGEYRFRYYVDHKIHGSNDKKSFYTIQPPPETTEEQIIGMGNLITQKLKEIMGCEITEYVEVRGDMDKFLFRLAQKDWFHFKKIDTKDPEQVKQFEKEYPGMKLKSDGTIPILKRRCNVLRKKQSAEPGKRQRKENV